MMADNTLKGIGGWLLVFIIWAGVSICVGIAYNIYNLIMVWQVGGIVRTLSIISTLVFTIWYVMYAILLLKFIRVKPGSLKPVMFMVIATPFLNLLMPGLCGIAAAAALPGVSAGDLLAQIYVKETLGSGIAAIVIAACWLVYFIKSVRVRNTFPESRAFTQ